MIKRIALAAVAVAAALPASAAAQSTPLGEPYDELCPRPSNPTCTMTPFTGDGWTVTGLAEPRPERLALYKKLLPKWFAMPETPMIAYSMVRFAAPGSFGQGSGDPEDGYMEGQVALRAKHGDETGWFLLGTPVNDAGQYDGGRLTGMPKYMADLTLRRTGEAWTATSTVQGKPSLVTERIAWTPKAPPPMSATMRKALVEWTTLQDPFYGTARPWDEPADPKCPARVKFTASPFVPVPGAPESPYTKLAPPKLGTSEVTVSRRYGPPSLKLWRDLVDEQQTVAGMFSYASGTVIVSSSRLEGCVNDSFRSTEPVIAAGDQGEPPAQPGTSSRGEDGARSTGPGTAIDTGSGSGSAAARANAPAVLPARRPCRSRRAFSIRVRTLKRSRPVRARVTINGRRASTVRGRAVRRPIRLRSLPAGRVTVKVSVRYADGKVRTTTRRYRTCAPRRR